MHPSVASLELPPFKARFPWWGGDLQTLATGLRPPAEIQHTEERLVLPLADGTGDVLLAMLDRPCPPPAGGGGGQGRAKPLAIVIHGLGGSEESIYVRSMARLLLERGHRVLRLNLRGAGASRATCADEYYAGRSQDFRALLALLPDELTRDGIVAVAYSLGAAMLLKYLGEEGSATPLVAAATVCAPIDLAAAGRSLMRPRNMLYHRSVLWLMQRNARGEGSALAADRRAALLKCSTVWEYDDKYIAPLHGYANAEDYYERCKPVRFMAGIRIPTLVLAAIDDPWVPIAAYRAYGWAENPALLPLLCVGGGHVGFHGAGRQPWSDLAIGRFFEKAVG